MTLNLFFDHTADKSNAVKHRNIVHIVFISLLLLGCGLVITMIFASYFKFAPFNETQTSSKTLSANSSIESSHDDVFNPQSNSDEYSFDFQPNSKSEYLKGSGIPFIKPINNTTHTELYFSFIRVGTQFYERPVTTDNNNDIPVTGIHWCNWKAFINNSIKNSEFKINHPIPFIFLTTGKEYYVRYYYEIGMLYDDNKTYNTGSIEEYYKTETKKINRIINSGYIIKSNEDRNFKVSDYRDTNTNISIITHNFKILHSDYQKDNTDFSRYTNITTTQV